MKSTSPKLKPCPFCGSSKLRVHDSPTTCAWVKCDQCMAYGPVETGINKAVKSWNKRAK